MVESSTQSWQDSFLARFKPKQKNTKIKISDEIRDQLVKDFRGDVLYDEPMSHHTYIRIGGKADLFVKPKSIQDLEVIMDIVHSEELPYVLFGSGSNTLVRDGGIRGVVIHVPSALNQFEVLDKEQGLIKVDAGVGITSCVNHCIQNGLTGMECLVGIPGTVGGAVVMNAGARGVEMQDLIREIQIMNQMGEIKTIPSEKLNFEYRKLKLPKNYIVLSAILKLEQGHSEEIEKTVREYQKKRAETQPLKFPNLGSIFKNPRQPSDDHKGIFAGELIEDLGLKGIRIGGARVSEIHANFIVNENKATSKDVEVLMNLVKDKVKEQTGYKLEPEIKIIGIDDES